MRGWRVRGRGRGPDGRLPPPLCIRGSSPLHTGRGATGETSSESGRGSSEPSWQVPPKPQGSGEGPRLILPEAEHGSDRHGRRLGGSLARGCTLLSGLQGQPQRVVSAMESLASLASGMTKTRDRSPELDLGEQKLR